MGENLYNSEDNKTACPYYFFYNNQNLCKAPDVAPNVKCAYQKQEIATEIAMSNYVGRVCGCKKIVQTHIDGNGHSDLEKKLGEETIKPNGEATIPPRTILVKSRSKLDNFIRS